MNKYNSAFKAYDIRWIFGQNIDKTLFYNLGRGVGKYILEHFWKDWKFIFGWDGRLANNDLISYFLFWMIPINESFCYYLSDEVEIEDFSNVSLIFLFKSFLLNAFK